MALPDGALERIVDTRVRRPQAVAAALAGRQRREVLAPDGKLFVVAADHPARGVVGAGEEQWAMANRFELLRRLQVALAHPRVDGVLASADIIEDLALLGALDGKIVIGTMNRGGLHGARWQMDDRMTAYDAEHLAAAGLEGGKMLLRIDNEDGSTAATIESCSRAVTALADRGLMAMVEPLPYTRDGHGDPVLDLSPDRMVRAVAVASGLGATSAYTWLKLPPGPGLAEALSATTCPALVLGGPADGDPRSALSSWEHALGHPQCRGLALGRRILFPPDGRVADAVAAAADLLDAAARP